MRGFKRSLAVVAASVLTAGTLLVAQTPIKLPKNKYTPEQDVEIGMKGAAEIRRQYPIIKDEVIARYLSGLGDRLVAVAPSNLKQPVYRYSFTPVNLKEINAFALPGGPMFVNRGMVEAAKGEGEVAGVMAHELAHVLLRHGTANATKAQNPWLQLGQIAGQVGGAMVGGNTGAIIAEGSGFGLGTLMLRYGRDYEKQADLLGSQMMAKAGYDPRDLAHMFETIAGESKGGAPQWMSSHPNPGNRTQYITKEAQALKIEGKADTSGFAPARKQFAGLPPAMTMAELAKRGPGSGGGTAGAESVGAPGKPVPAPSSQLRAINAGIFQASVPSNWKNLQSDSALRVVPENGYGEMNGQTVFTHGIEFGVAKASSRDLKEATATWLKAIAQGNPELKQAGESKYVKMSERTALGIPLINPSPLGGREAILLFTTFLTNGDLFYYLAVAPEADMNTYQPVFVKIGQSIKITDVR
ncbi:MAG TPA: M48 family metallopeptidase [Vicinamibacterales bacterium]|nr:M48 family metallopeptidase [Vicinamibacterales bacterium]